MKNIIKGTPEQFMQAVEDKIAELGGRDTISQSVDIQAAADTDSKEERYIHSLIGELETRLEEALSENTEIVVDSMLFDADSHNLYITVAYDGNVDEYTVPYADLKFDWDDMQSDTSYVVNEIVSDVSAQPNK